MRRAGTDRGNVLFLILLAVALLAALSFAVSRSGRSNGNAGREQSILAATSLIQYAGSMRDAVNRLLLAGCAENQITFQEHNSTSFFADGTPLTNTYNNANAPANKTCHIFNPMGGNITPRRLYDTEGWITPSLGFGFWGPFSDSWMAVLAEVIGVGEDDSSDLILMVGRLSKEQCMAINDVLGVTNPSAAPPVDFFNSGYFSGTYTNVAARIGDESGNVLAGKKGFCLSADAPNVPYRYHLMYVLLAR